MSLMVSVLGLWLLMFGCIIFGLWILLSVVWLLCIIFGNNPTTLTRMKDIIFTAFTNFLKPVVGFICYLSCLHVLFEVFAFFQLCLTCCLSNFLSLSNIFWMFVSCIVSIDHRIYISCTRFCLHQTSTFHRMGVFQTPIWNTYSLDCHLILKSPLFPYIHIYNFFYF